MNLAVNARDAMLAPGGGRLIFQTENAPWPKGPLCCRPARTWRSASSTPAAAWTPKPSATCSSRFSPPKSGEGHCSGLSTAYGIVKQHGGHIEAVSQPGHRRHSGFCFRVEAPPSREAHLAEVRPAGCGSARLLVVEDEEMVRKMVCDILRAHGYRVLDAPGPDEALALRRKSPRPSTWCRPT